ncbi:MAG: sigma 54-interacting transcriptional regulator, partial [candidate division Zixibacteria bacterium]|nr:sigma 54-interacting transcriptional regulator [candidate division Zixibacteria bacterium]
MESNNKSNFHLTHALVKALQGNINEALTLIDKCTALPQEFKRERAIYFEYLGWIYNLAGRYQDAITTLKTGIELSLKIAPESALISQSKRLLADAYVGMENFTLAEKTASEAMVVAEKINERAEIAACKRVFALVAVYKQNTETARTRFAEAIDIFSQIGSRYELAVTRYLAAVSGVYTNGERAAMLYMAHEYFISEDVAPYIALVEKGLAKFVRPTVKPESLAKNDVYIAVHPRSRKIVELAENIARSDMTVLLTGPTGSGKDQLAKYIHAVSNRDGPFVAVNTAAVPDSMAEAELFGYVRGAFTGAEHDKPGLFTIADGGTIYLNEIADSSPNFQAKLLEVLESKRVRALGTTEWKTVRVRVIAATNHDLDTRMRSGSFRVDLYHRLRGVDITLPPLKDRPEDIAELVRHFFARDNDNGSVDPDGPAFTRLCEALAEHTWPGNVRELESVIKRLTVLGGHD